MKTAVVALLVSSAAAFVPQTAQTGVVGLTKVNGCVSPAQTHAESLPRGRFVTLVPSQLRARRPHGGAVRAAPVSRNARVGGACRWGSLLPSLRAAYAAMLSSSPLPSRRRRSRRPRKPRRRAATSSASPRARRSSTSPTGSRRWSTPRRPRAVSRARARGAGSRGTFPRGARPSLSLPVPPRRVPLL